MKKLTETLVVAILFICLLTSVSYSRNLITLTEDMLYKSDDSAGSWKGIYVNSSARLRYRNLAIDHTGKNIYAASSLGVLKSSDRGNKWHIIYPSGRPELVNKVFTGNSTGRALYAVTSDALYFSGTEGKNWKKLGLPMKEAFFCSAFYNENKLFIDGGSRIMLSRDHGFKWSSIGDKIAANFTVLDMAVNPFNSNEIYAATNIGLFHTTNCGKNWKKRNISSKDWVRTKVITFTGKPGVIYVIDEDTKEDGQSFFRKSVNNGKSWQLLATKDHIIGYGVDISNPNVVFYAYIDSTSVYNIYNSQITLAKSINGGKSWSAIDNITPGYGKLIKLYVIP